jgi:hypothetical protein
MLVSSSSSMFTSTSSSCTMGLNSAAHSSSSAAVSSSPPSSPSAPEDAKLRPVNPPKPVPAPNVEAEPKIGVGEASCGSVIRLPPLPKGRPAGPGEDHQRCLLRSLVLSLPPLPKCIQPCVQQPDEDGVVNTSCLLPLAQAGPGGGVCRLPGAGGGVWKSDSRHAGLLQQGFQGPVKLCCRVLFLLTRACCCCCINDAMEERCAYGGSCQPLVHLGTRSGVRQYPTRVAMAVAVGNSVGTPRCCAC